VFEALHDIGDPVGALRTARALLAADGSVLVADERVADTFTTPEGSRRGTPSRPAGSGFCWPRASPRCWP
jgi:hypothetical protein